MSFNDSHEFHNLSMLVISNRGICMPLSLKNIAVLSSRVPGYILVTIYRDKSWLYTSSKPASITARFWVPIFSVFTIKLVELQTNYFLTRDFWPRSRLILLQGVHRSAFKEYWNLLWYLMGINLKFPYLILWHNFKNTSWKTTGTS